MLKVSKQRKGGLMKTGYVCCFCPSNLGLHSDLCFELYHNVLNYSNHEKTTFQ